MMDTDLATAAIVLTWTVVGIMGMCWSFKHGYPSRAESAFGWVLVGPLLWIVLVCYEPTRKRRRSS